MHRETRLTATVCSGIEVIACIQTLGHLGQMLQWPKYGTLRDTAEVLLAEYSETYNFIEKVWTRHPGESQTRAHPVYARQMVKAICAPLRSKRIHIGMDEAHGVSEGRYRQFFGYKESTKVVRSHDSHRETAVSASRLAHSSRITSRKSTRFACAMDFRR